MNRFWMYIRFVLVMLPAWASLPGNALAAEGGRSLYLLGKQGPTAGLNPNKGWHVTNDVFYYNSDNDGSVPQGENINQGTSTDVIANTAQLTWVTGARLLGGRLALGLVVPYGSVKVDADASSRTPSGLPASTGDSERDTNFGDPELSASLAWRKQSDTSFMTASLYSSVFIPAGSYNQDSIANMGSNRWGVDVGSAFAARNFGTGGEMSGVVGFTFNGDNEDTNYQTGTEFHAELSLQKNLSQQWGLGVAGYFYKQITNDSGGPVNLGNFKGRVTGAGPQVNYRFRAANRSMGLNLRWYHEFSTTNRAEGDAVFLTLSVPLRADAASAK